MVISNPVKITKEFLCIHKLVKLTLEQYLIENMLFENEPGYTKKDCLEELKFAFLVGPYAEMSRKCGLELNQTTLNALRILEIPDAVLATPIEELPRKYAFSIDLNEGRGGLFQLEFPI